MYNFDEIIDRRNTNAVNTDDFRSFVFNAGPDDPLPFKDEEFIRMWVADMEFAAAPEIMEALEERLKRRIFGYTKIGTDTSYYDVFRKWCLDHYDWDFPREELCHSAGIVPAIYQLMENICGKNDKVLITTPSYISFHHAIEYNQVDYLVSPLLLSEEGAYSLEFVNLEQQCVDPNCKLLIWCNPHNPTGHMWTQEELESVAQIIRKYNLWVISDEIHCDVIRCGKRHIPLGKVMPDYRKLITCMAPTKTFNLAGLAFSNIIIRDERMREQFRLRDKQGGCLNAMSLTAAKAAYEKGGAWHEQLKAYLDENFRYVHSFLAEFLPEAKMQISDATYLAWVNLEPCIPDINDMASFFGNEAGVLLEGGDVHFVGNAKGYVRLNLAMPRVLLVSGMERIRDAVYRHRKN